MEKEILHVIMNDVKNEDTKILYPENSDKDVMIDPSLKVNASTLNDYIVRNEQVISSIKTDMESVVNGGTKSFRTGPFDIQVSEWNENLEYVYTDVRIEATDKTDVYFNSNSYNVVNKAGIRVMSDTGERVVRLKATKIPKETLSVDFIEVVKNYV